MMTNNTFYIHHVMYQFEFATILNFPLFLWEKTK